MIFTDQVVNASGPTNARLMAIGMAPAKAEVATGIPFVGASGALFNEALETNKTPRATVRVTNLCNFFIDDNNLYTVPQHIMEQQLARVFDEIEAIRPNVLLIQGADTLDFLTASKLTTRYNKRKQRNELVCIGSKKGIVKWRGSVIEILTPKGHKQKCVASMHPAAFVRGQWKWLLPYKYIDVRRAVTQSLFPEMRLTPRVAHIAPSFQQVLQFLEEAQQQEWVSIDYEGRDSLSCLGIGWNASEAMCIPLSRVGSPYYWQQEEEVAIWKSWCNVLQNPKVKKIAQNASYEWLRSWQHGIFPNPLGADTMHMHHCLYPDFGGVSDEWQKRKRDIDNPGHGLAFITSQYTDVPFYKDDGRHWTPDLGEQAFWRYNAMDVMVTYEAAMKMMNELRNNNLWETYQQQYLDVFEAALAMEWHGIAQDMEKRRTVYKDLQADLAFWSDQLKALTGYNKVVSKAEGKGKPPKGVLNLRSSKQMQHFLYNERKYKQRLNRKTGNITVDKDTLNLLAASHPEDKSLALIIKMRDVQHFIDNVINASLDNNNRIHCHFKLGGTNGTRWSSTESILGSGCNLQNIPRTGPGRSFFLAM